MTLSIDGRLSELIANSPVLETYIREVTTLVHLTVNGEEIVATVDHPFYVKKSRLYQSRRTNSW